MFTHFYLQTIELIDLFMYFSHLTRTRMQLLLPIKNQLILGQP